MTMRPKFNRGGRLFRPSQDLKVDKHSVTAVRTPPTASEEGIDVSKQSFVLLSITSNVAFAVAPAGLAVVVNIWRLKTEPSTGQINPAGVWFVREQLTVGLDGNPATGPQEYGLPTLNSEKMFYELVSITADTPEEVPAGWEITFFTTELGSRNEKTGDACCPGLGATQAVTSVSLDCCAEHGEPVEDEGIHPMLEAANINGDPLPNAVLAGEAIRAKASREGVALGTLLTVRGDAVAVLEHDEAIDPGRGEVGVVMAGAQAQALGALTAVDPGDSTRIKTNNLGGLYNLLIDATAAATPALIHDQPIAGTAQQGVLMAGAEAKTFDGAAFPTVVVEGDATRVAGSLFGVGYTMPVSQDGGVSPIAEDEVALAVDGRIGLMTAGAEVQAAAPAPLAAGLAVALNTNTLKHLITAGYEFPDNHNRGSETDPLDAKHGTTPFADATVTAAPLVRYFPDEDGHSLADRKATSLQAVIRGGVDALAADVTATLTIEGTNGMIDPATAAVRWEDITMSVLNMVTGASGVASWTSVGVVYTYLLLCLGNANMTHFRARVEWDEVPDAAATAGFARMTPRTRAL